MARGSYQTSTRHDTEVCWKCRTLIPFQRRMRTQKQLRIVMLMYVVARGGSTGGGRASASATISMHSPPHHAALSHPFPRDVPKACAGLGDRLARTLVNRHPS